MFVERYPDGFVYRRIGPARRSDHCIDTGIALSRFSPLLRGEIALLCRQLSLLLQQFRYPLIERFAATSWSGNRKGRWTGIVCCGPKCDFSSNIADNGGSRGNHRTSPAGRHDNPAITAVSMGRSFRK